MIDSGGSDIVYSAQSCNGVLDSMDASVVSHLNLSQTLGTVTVMANYRSEILLPPST